MWCAMHRMASFALSHAECYRLVCTFLFLFDLLIIIYDHLILDAYTDQRTRHTATHTHAQNVVWQFLICATFVYSHYILSHHICIALSVAESMIRC